MSALYAAALHKADLRYKQKSLAKQRDIKNGLSLAV
jgi:hypothetical protein